MHLIKFINSLFEHVHTFIDITNISTFHEQSFYFIEFPGALSEFPQISGDPLPPRRFQVQTFPPMSRFILSLDFLFVGSRLFVLHGAPSALRLICVYTDLNLVYSRVPKRAASRPLRFPASSRHPSFVSLSSAKYPDGQTGVAFRR